MRGGVACALHFAHATNPLPRFLATSGRFPSSIGRVAIRTVCTDAFACLCLIKPTIRNQLVSPAHGTHVPLLIAALCHENGLHDNAPVCLLLYLNSQLSDYTSLALYQDIRRLFSWVLAPSIFLLLVTAPARRAISSLPRVLLPSCQ